MGRRGRNSPRVTLELPFVRAGFIEPIGSEVETAQQTQTIAVVHLQARADANSRS